MNDHEIFLLADECDQSFQKALAAALPNRPVYRSLLACHQRFELWAGFVGAFADEQASLDRRLKFSPDLQRAVVQLLLLVRKSLQRDLASDQQTFAHSKPPSLKKTPDANDGTKLSHLPPTAQAGLGAIHEAIDRLQRIATSIRRGSSSSITSRVQGFARKFDEDHFDRIAILLVRGLLPDTAESLAKQLASSIAFRRLRLLYQRRHQQKLQMRRQIHLQRHNGHEEQDMEPSSSGLAVQPRVQSVSRVTATQGHLPTESLSATEHSILHPDFVRDDSSDKQSVISSLTMISSVAQSYLYPAPPKPVENSEYCCCNWCFEEVKTEKLKLKGWWTSHFNKDLEPYVCISEECQDPPIYFSTISKWQKHMKTIHTTHWAQEVHKTKVWYCEMSHASQSGLKQYNSAEELDQHLSADHSDILTPSKIKTKLRRNVLSQSRGPGICPLCNIDLNENPYTEKDFAIDEAVETTSTSLKAQRVRVTIQAAESGSISGHDDSSDENTQPKVDSSGPLQESRSVAQVKLSKHVAQHLKSLAFLSLRWFEDNEAATDASDHNSCGARSGQTIKDKREDSSTDSLTFIDETTELPCRFSLHTTSRVLMAFPLITAALEFYLEGVSVTMRFSGYKQDFRKLIRGVSTERTIFTNSCEMILTGILSAEDRARFMSEGYASRKHEEKLERRLSAMLLPYTSVVENMMEAMERIRLRLNLDSEFTVQFDESKTFKENYKRLKFSLNKSDYDQTVKDLEEANHQLHTIVNRALTITASQLPLDFAHIQKHAGRLHRALSQDPSFQESFRTVPPAEHSSRVFLDLRVRHTSKVAHTSSDNPLHKPEPFHIIFSGDVRTTWSSNDADCYSILDPEPLPTGLEFIPIIIRNRAEHIYALFPSQVGPGDLASISRLDDVLLDVNLGRKRRLEIGLLAAHGLLQLAGTPWLRGCWTKNIFIQHETDYIDVSKSAHSQKTHAESSNMTSSSSETAQRTRQDQSYRHGDVNPYVCSGKASAPNISVPAPKFLQIPAPQPVPVFISPPSTDMRVLIASSLDSETADQEVEVKPDSLSRIIRNYDLYQLGVLLIELWYGKSLHALYRNEDGPLYRPADLFKDPGDLHVDPFTEYTTADLLVDELYADAGDKYSDAVRRCIRCDFEHRSSDLTDPQLLQEVHDGVYQTLYINYNFGFGEDSIAKAHVQTEQIDEHPAAAIHGSGATRTWSLKRTKSVG